LRSHGIPDWPEWSGAGTSAYIRHVRMLLEVRYKGQFMKEVANHARPVSYLSYCTGAAPDLRSALGLQMGWSTLVGQRVVAQLRADLLNLGHNDGKLSRAKVQSCIACNARTRQPSIHCLVACSRFSLLRAQVLAHYPHEGWEQRELARQLLGTRPDFPAYAALVAMVHEIAVVERSFWVGKAYDLCSSLARLKHYCLSG
jgi:hypothetical protein